LNRSQRLHFIELMSRSVQYYHDIREDEGFRAKAAREFPSESSVSFSPFLFSERYSMSAAIWDNGSSQLLDQRLSHFHLRYSEKPKLPRFDKSSAARSSWIVRRNSRPSNAVHSTHCQPDLGLQPQRLSSMRNTRSGSRVYIPVQRILQ
jgi:hypothetical protein